MKFVPSLSLSQFLAGVLAMSAFHGEAADPKDCRLCNLELTKGMKREEVEEKVAVSLGTQSTYSPYGNNLRGGVVLYRDGVWVLKVTYKSGAPAPWVLNKDGIAEHYPPMDETILSHEVFTAKL